MLLLLLFVDRYWLFIIIIIILIGTWYTYSRFFRSLVFYVDFQCRRSKEKIQFTHYHHDDWAKVCFFFCVMLLSCIKIGLNCFCAITLTLESLVNFQLSSYGWNGWKKWKCFSSWMRCLCLCMISLWNHLTLNTLVFILKEWEKWFNFFLIVKR